MFVLSIWNLKYKSLKFLVSLISQCFSQWSELNYRYNQSFSLFIRGKESSVHDRWIHAHFSMSGSFKIYCLINLFFLKLKIASSFGIFLLYYHSDTIWLLYFCNISFLTSCSSCFCLHCQFYPYFYLTTDSRPNITYYSRRIDLWCYYLLP